MKTRTLMAVAVLMLGSTAMSPAHAQQAAVTDSSTGSELIGLTCERLASLDGAALEAFLQGYEAGFLDGVDPDPTGPSPAESSANTAPVIGEPQAQTSIGSAAVADTPVPSGDAGPVRGGVPATATAEASPASPPANAAAPRAVPPTGELLASGSAPTGPSMTGTGPSPRPAGTAPTEVAVHPMVAACATGPDSTLAQAFANRFGLADPAEAADPTVLPSAPAAPGP